MDLSVVRIHKANSSTGSPWVHTRPVVHPDKYLSQSPFILLNEESYTPNSEFPIQCHKGIVAVTLVLDGALKQTDAAGSQLELNHGDAGITMGDGGLLRGKTPGESGVRLLHLWLDLPAALKCGDSRHEVVRHDSARRAAFGDASALVYAGTLGEACAPHVSPWPITMADMHLPSGAVA